MLGEREGSGDMQGENQRDRGFKSHPRRFLINPLGSSAQIPGGPVTIVGAVAVVVAAAAAVFVKRKKK